MVLLILKAVGIWLVIAFVAMLNGLLREKVLVPAFNRSVALPVSGIVLSVLVLSITYWLIPLFGTDDQYIYLTIGMLWVGLTLAFEFIVGHYVAGKPWCEIFRVFDLRSGDLFLIVLLITAISPWLAAHIRGLI